MSSKELSHSMARHELRTGHSLEAAGREIDYPQGLSMLRLVCVESLLSTLLCFFASCRAELADWAVHRAGGGRGLVPSQGTCRIKQQNTPPHHTTPAPSVRATASDYRLIHQLAIPSTQYPTSRNSHPVRPGPMPTTQSACAVSCVCMCSKHLVSRRAQSRLSRLEPTSRRL